MESEKRCTFYNSTQKCPESGCHQLSINVFSPKDSVMDGELEPGDLEPGDHTAPLPFFADQRATYFDHDERGWTAGGVGGGWEGAGGGGRGFTW